MSSSPRLCSYYVILFIIVVSINILQAQDVGFPENGDEEPSKKNAAHRIPVYMPGRCQENQLLYPGDQVDDWICDCSPGHLFYPNTDKCYPAYRQGPCPASSYLVLPKDKVIPECRMNPCRRDGSVLVQKRCYNLGEAGPCPQPELSYVLAVNVTTLDLTCVRLSVILANRLGDDEPTTTLPVPTYVNLSDVPACAKGCKRYINGTCPLPVSNNVGKGRRS